MSNIEPPPLIGALLRVPSQVIHRRLIAELNAAGFTDLRLAHMAVLSYPAADGYRPIELAERAGISKQAMNQLLQSLEQLGYIERSVDEANGRARIVHFTARGHAAWDTELEVLAEIEREWRASLGGDTFDRLKDLLSDLWVSDLIP
ncbi:MAG TPA: MarR family winged helix-turn-helix transcriptional regulator [Dehalococcoidia bacterium]|nr:MarR family winged helix-turn-helix transcriptional regulator [Dehalococcoidia bacterium]